MTYKEHYMYLRLKTAEAYNNWLLAQNELSSEVDGFTNQDLWDKLDLAASDLQKAQNEFNKLCTIIQKGKFNQHDTFGDQQACA